MPFNGKIKKLGLLRYPGHTGKRGGLRTHIAGFQNQGHCTEQVHISIEDHKFNKEASGATVQPVAVFKML